MSCPRTPAASSSAHGRTTLFVITRLWLPGFNGSLQHCWQRVGLPAVQRGYPGKGRGGRRRVPGGAGWA